MSNAKFYSLLALIVATFLLEPSWENYHNAPKPLGTTIALDTTEAAAGDDCNCTDSDVGCIVDCQDAREQEPELINLPPMD